MRSFLMGAAFAASTALSAVGAIDATLTLKELSSTPIQTSVIHGAALPGEANRDRVLMLDFATGAIFVYDKSDNAFSVVVDKLTIDGVDLGGGRPNVAYSLAAAPDFEDTGHVYVSATSSVPADPQSGASETIENVILRLSLTTNETGALVVNAAEPTKRIATIPYPQGAVQNGHAGGAIAFDDQGNLFITTGDGGDGQGASFGVANAGGPSTAQIEDVATPLGALLRIDPRGDDFPDDPNNNYAVPDSNPSFGDASYPGVVARGLRNPFKAAFDAETNTLVIGDVGKNDREEINVYVVDQVASPLNYQWPRFEGALDFDLSADLLGEPTGPIYEYTHGAGLFEGFSVTGGFVYRGPIEALDGLYIFGDFGGFGGGEPRARPIWGLDLADPQSITAFELVFEDGVSPILRLLGIFGDEAGHLYVSDFNGRVFSVVVTPIPPALLMGLGALGLLVLGPAALRRRTR